MAELQVGIRADTGGAKKVVRSLESIKRAGRATATSLAQTSAAATQTSVSLQTTVSASGKLAVTQNLAATANVAVAKTLGAVAVKAAETAAAEKAATTQTNFLTAAMQRFSLAGTKAFLKVGAGAKRFTTQMRTAAGSVAGMSIAAQGFGALIAVGIGVGIKNALALEKSFSRIEGLVGLAANEVEAFKKPLNDIAKATGKGPNELAEALFFITSAGFEGAEAMDVLNASARAAAAGLGETKQVADAVTSAVNAYGIENLNAAQATDILVATVREGKAAADSIAGALGQILPSASELGVEFEELGGAIAALTRIGLGADQAATALGATMAAIQKPGNDAKLALKEFGLTASGLRKTVREEGLLVGLQQMKEAFGDNETALTRVIPNIRALRAVLPLVGRNAGNVADIFEAVADSAGAADDAFDVYAKTTSFELDQAMVVLQTTLIKVGNDLLPAVTLAFVKLASGVEKTINAFSGLGEAVARAISGSAEPIVRLNNDLIKTQQKIGELSSVKVEGFFGKVDKAGLPIIEKKLVAQNQLEKSLNAQINETFGLNILGQEVTGTVEEQLEILRDIEGQLISNIEQTEKENAAREATTETTALMGDALQISKNILKSLATIDAPPALDPEELAKGEKALTNLTAEVAFLTGDLTNLQELGQDGIGLQEDFTETKLVVDQLQGSVTDAASVVRQLVNDKRELAAKIEEVTEAFARQDGATDFLKDLAMDTALLQEKFAALSAGGTLIDITSLQQAQQIFDDLGDKQGGRTVESIQQEILLQNALNTAISQIPVDKFEELVTQVELLQALNVDPESSYFGQLGPQIDAVGDAAIDAVLKAQGLSGLDQILLDAMPKEQQFEEAGKRLRAAFDLKGIVDPETNPEFIAALEALRQKIFSVGDATEQFAIQAARNLQSAFADFLFDPFEDGLDGMLRNFGETLKRMAAEALSQQILSSLFSSLGAASGGGGILGAIAGAFADGGAVQANKTVLVGERGPELFQPGQSGNIVSNEMMNGQAQQAPTVNVAPAPVIVVDDPSKVEKALQTADGQRALVNAVTEKRGAINQALGR